MSKTVQEQFGANAEKYVTSTVHAKGYSLQRMVEMTNPQSHWHTLDIATGGGHTAHTFAPHIAKAWATDITPPMLDAASKHGGSLGLDNVVYEVVDAMNFPYPDNSFDLVTCRIAPHHFPDIRAFVRESFRVLKQGGKLAVVDNVVPGKTGKGRKPRLQREAGDYINAIETLRDPSHAKALSIEGWRDHFYETGFAPIEYETLRKKMDFSSWSTRLPMSPDDHVRLQAMFIQAPDIAAEFLAVEPSGTSFIFYLTEIVIVGEKPS